MSEVRPSTSCALIVVTNCLVTSCGVIDAKNVRDEECGLAGQSSDFHGDVACAGVKKTVAQRNTNTAAAPDHSQNPRCQKTECRRALRIGIAQAGFSCVSSNKDSLKKIPASGNSVTNDQVQNSGAGKRLRPQPFHAHQQPNNIPIAMNPAAERPRNSCSRRIPNTACTGAARRCMRKLAR